MSERQVKKRFLLLTELIRTLAENAFSYGGGLGIRTLATVTRPNDLANRPLQPLE